MSSTKTQLKLNTIRITRASLTFAEAVLVWKLRLKGEAFSLIAAKFGTNQGRISDVLTGKVHPDAKLTAIDSLQG
ncbi:MAG: hypothetical protein H5U24_03295 [Thioclava marina]|nr:hypothetical protein [Thioclava marina]